MQLGLSFTLSGPKIPWGQRSPLRNRTCFSCPENMAQVALQVWCRSRRSQWPSNKPSSSLPCRCGPNRSTTMSSRHQSTRRFPSKSPDRETHLILAYIPIHRQGLSVFPLFPSLPTRASNSPNSFDNSFGRDTCFGIDSLSWGLLLPIGAETAMREVQEGILVTG
jgi:hypothetical protein